MAKKRVKYIKSNKYQPEDAQVDILNPKLKTM